MVQCTVYACIILSNWYWCQSLLFNFFVCYCLVQCRFRIYIFKVSTVVDTNTRVVHCTIQNHTAAAEHFHKARFIICLESIHSLEMLEGLTLKYYIGLCVYIYVHACTCYSKKLYSNSVFNIKNIHRYNQLYKYSF